MSNEFSTMRTRAHTHIFHFLWGLWHFLRVFGTEPNHSVQILQRFYAGRKILTPSFAFFAQNASLLAISLSPTNDALNQETQKPQVLQIRSTHTILINPSSSSTKTTTKHASYSWWMGRGGCFSVY